METCWHLRFENLTRDSTQNNRSLVLSLCSISNHPWQKKNTNRIFDRDKNPAVQGIAWYSKIGVEKSSCFQNKIIDARNHFRGKANFLGCVLIYFLHLFLSCDLGLFLLFQISIFSFGLDVIYLEIFAESFTWNSADLDI